MTPEDKDLILRAIRGDPDAINQVADRYADFARHVAWGMVRNSADAADITQEVLLKLVSSLHTLETVESFQGWVYRIAYRMSLNWLRARGNLPLVEGLPTEDIAATDSSEEPDREELLARIADVAKDLPQPYVLIVKMFYYENRSCREIASILRIGEGTVKVQLHRARAMMRKMLEER